MESPTHSFREMSHVLQQIKNLKLQIKTDEVEKSSIFPKNR